MPLFGPNVYKMFKKQDVDGLIKALQHQSRSVREEAIPYLALLGDKRAVEPLAALVNDPDEYESLRLWATLARGDLGDQRVVESVIEALNHNDEDVRECAAEALGKLGDQRAVEPLIAVLNDEEETESVHREAAHTLGKLGDKRAIIPIIATLNDDIPVVRENAAFLLGELGDKCAVEPLTTVLKNDDEETVRRAATIALQKLSRQ
jgi:HEAT repeat protein